MSTHPKITEQLDELVKAANGHTSVTRIVEMAKARLAVQDELLEVRLTVRDSYAMAALTGFCSRRDLAEFEGSRLSECFRIADLMMELRRG